MRTLNAALANLSQKFNTIRVSIPFFMYEAVTTHSDAEYCTNNVQEEIFVSYSRECIDLFNTL